ncbi:MAG: glycoside hydrolase family 2 TIM barrel-domain containing protein [Rikenellaceae bacterium]
MRLLLSFLSLLLSLVGAQAQNLLLDSSPKLDSRSEIIPYASLREPRSGASSALSYYIVLDDWMVSGDELTASFSYKKSWIGRDVIFRLEAAASPYSLLVNGEEVAGELNRNAPAEFEITKFVKDGSNKITLRLEPERRLSALESWTSKMPDKIMGASVSASSGVGVSDVTAYADSDGAHIGIELSSNRLNEKSVKLKYTLYRPNGAVAKSGVEEMNFVMKQKHLVPISVALPEAMAWSALRPQFHRLDITLYSGGSVLECNSIELGLVAVMWRDGMMRVNGHSDELRVAEVAPFTSYNELKLLQLDGYNTILLRAGEYDSSIYDLCDRMGMYVIATAPINSSAAGEDITIGGNPTNDPAMQEHYIARNQANYYAARRHPSVIAFAIAESSLNGNNLYESYLSMKRMERKRPIIYFGANGEWNSDKLNISRYNE